MTGAVERAYGRGLAAEGPSKPTLGRQQKGVLGRLTPGLTRQLLVGLFLLLCSGFFHQAPLFNEPSRYDLVVAIVDEHTTQIDSNQKNTGDKAFYNGHYYSDKAPGTAFLGIPPYALMRVVRAVTHQPAPDSDQAIQVLAFVVCAIPTALLAVLLMRFLAPIVESAGRLS